MSGINHVVLQFNRVGFLCALGGPASNERDRRSMGRGKPSANSAKRSPDPGYDSNGRLQQQGLPSPRLAPSLSSRSNANGYSNGSYEEEAPSPPQTKPLYLCSPFVEAALVKGNFKTIVMLPKYVDIMEWVAVNSMSVHLRACYERLTILGQVFDFYTNLNEFYGVVSEVCTSQTCKTMSAGPTYALSNFSFFLPTQHPSPD